MYGGPLFEILAVGGLEFADPRGTRSGSPHFGNLSTYLSIYLFIYLSIDLSICLSKTLYRELGMVRPRQEFLNVSYLSIYLPSYLAIFNLSIYLSTYLSKTHYRELGMVRPRVKSMCKKSFWLKSLWVKICW